MKYRLFITLAFAFTLNLIAQNKAPENWFNLDRNTDKVWGISTEKAYKELPIGKNSNKIIVAVIDGGTDVSHEDLKANLWVNPKEIAGNGLDDDNNGYKDDVYGWNFIGGKDGNVKDDTYEYTRILGSYLEKGVAKGQKPTFANDKERILYEKATELQDKQWKEINGQYEMLSGMITKVKEMIAKTGSTNPTAEQIDKIPAETKEDKNIKFITKYIVKTGGMEKSPIVTNIKNAADQLEVMVKCNLNVEYNSRKIVGDNYADLSEHFYGNNQVEAPKTDHGTHVAGIIAADRNNDLGIKGINDKALIMTLRVVPNGDERDKDIANAIRYAADNGAKVINMSFGKKLSPNKELVDDAVKYALSKDVLLVHAAGNDGVDLNVEEFFPQANISGTAEKFPNWIEVGASNWESGKKRVASFSNYGKGKVEIFAPGVDITSSTPESKYESFDGTSMASPVVAGVAALVRQNYPNLTAIQTKQILMMSAVPCKERIRIPGKKKRSKLHKISVSGGIVNAYEALVLAEKVSKGEVKLPQ